jgi:MFS family permease
MILRVSPSVMTYELMQDFQVSSVTLGVLSSFYYYAYVIFQIPCGLFVDKLGPRRIITFSSLLCVIGAFLFAKSSCLLSAQIGRFLIGAGSACAFISCLKITAEWFKPTQFALIAGLTNMMGTLGATFGARPLATLVNLFGWRQSIFLMALAGIPVALLAWFFIKDHSSKQPEIDQKQTTKSSIRFGQSLKIIGGNKQVWLAGIIGGFMYLPISAFTELWAIPFLISSYEVNNEFASSMSVMLVIGMAFGSPLSAWWAGNLEPVFTVAPIV